MLSLLMFLSTFDKKVLLRISFLFNYKSYLWGSLYFFIQILNSSLIKVKSCLQYSSAIIFPEMLQLPNGQEVPLLYSHHQPTQSPRDTHLSKPGRCLEMTRKLSLREIPFCPAQGTQCFLNWNNFDAMLGTHSPHLGPRPTAAHINWSISLILWSYMTQAPHWCLWKEQHPLYLAWQLHQQVPYPASWG